MSILFAMLFSGQELQTVSCGIPPILPPGCTGSVCVCDDLKANCNWVFICG